MGKIIFVLITAIFLFTLASCTTASKKSIKDYEKASDIIFTIYSHDGKSESELLINSLGHAWLSVENQGNESIEFNSYEIAPEESLYFGTWGNSAKWGVCYNMEPNFSSQFGRYDGTISLSARIDSYQLDEIARFVSNNDLWNIIQNCSWFAIQCWNTAMDDEIDLPEYWIYTPANLSSNIMQYEEYKVNKPMTGAKGIFFYNENKELEELQLCETY